MSGFKEFQFTDEAKKLLKAKEAIKGQLAKGEAAQEILGFSKDVMAKFYQTAYRLLKKRRFEDAGNAFIFLVTLNPYMKEYWIGLGMATQMHREYELAMSAYEMAAIVQMGDPVPYLYLAKCLFAVNERKSALEALDMALEYSAEGAEYNELRREAFRIREQLLKRL